MSNKIILNRKRGDTTSYFLDLVDDSKQPLDITGASATFSVSQEREPDTASYVFQITGSISGDPLAGQFEFPFTATEANNNGKFYFDIQYINSGGKIRTVKYGVIIFGQDITK